MKITCEQLTRAYLRDLVTDIRCARRDGLYAYSLKVIVQFRELWPHRHLAKTDRHGMPKIPNLPQASI